MNLKIKSEYRALVIPLTDKQYNQLKHSIKENGLWVPIIVNQDGVILDGHHRARACSELGIECKYVTKQFEDKDLEELFVIKSNMQRRHLCDCAKGWQALKAEPALRRIAERHQKAGVPQDLGEGHRSGGYVNEELGKLSNLSHESMRRIKKIRDTYYKDKEKWRDSVEEGCWREKQSIEFIWKQMTRSQDHQNTPALPSGEYDVILADPPWKYDISLRGTPENQYQGMDIDEIKKLEVPSADNAILFLWTTVSLLEKSFAVIKAWGFKYTSSMVWIKDKIGIGHYIRGRHEYLLIAVKGKMPTPETSNRPDSVIEAPASKHSEKPEIIYDIIEKMYPNRQYLELFARSKHSKKWTVWGIEAPVIK